MDEISSQPIEELVQQVQRRELSRTRFMRLLGGLGASTAGIATLLASTGEASARVDIRDNGPDRPSTHLHHKRRHHSHVTRQGSATQSAPGTTDEAGQSFRQQKLRELMTDYADDAIVDDPLFAGPIVGKQAIAQRKALEMAAMTGVTIEIVHRFVHGKQLVAEWIVRGIHHGALLNFAPTGRSIEVRGMTVVTRENGKIVRESLFYDLGELHRQLG
ncbi:MAG: ester cyclase [Chloroflexota bacterium]|nr:MAG: hypothetical protein DLM70_03120 [Chloroflexota bacterium]